MAPHGGEADGSGRDGDRTPSPVQTPLTAVRQFIDALPMAVLVASPGWHVTLANRRAEVVFGRPAWELLTQPLARLLPAEFVQRAREMERAAGTVSLTDEARLPVGHPEARPFHITLSVPPTPAGEPVGVLCLLQERLPEVPPTAGEPAGDLLGEMASGIIHRFGNISSSILLQAQAALRQQPAESVAAVLRAIEGSALGARSTLGLLRQYAEAGPITDVRPVSASQLVVESLAGAAALWRPSPPPGGPVAVEARLESSRPLPADAARLRQAIGHLLLNAREAMPAGGRLAVRTVDEETATLIAVSDTGPGMSPEVQRRAAEPFFTTKGEDTAGLGLSIVERVVRGHGGQVVLDAAEGRGTTVVLRLPVERPASVPAAQAASPFGQTIPVLTVEQDLATRNLLADALLGMGCEVAHAATIAEARELAGRTAYAAVILDPGMEAGAGAQLARTLKAGRPALRVVLLADAGRLYDPADAPADLLLVKPVGLPALQALVEALRAGQRQPETR